MAQAYWDAYGDVLERDPHARARGDPSAGSAPGDFFDPLGEAKASCYGMQWMPFVAQQLGATADDAQAIARYYWDVIYPAVPDGAYSAVLVVRVPPGRRAGPAPPGNDRLAVARRYERPSEKAQGRESAGNGDAPIFVTTSVRPPSSNSCPTAGGSPSSSRSE